MKISLALKKGDEKTKVLFKEYLESKKYWVFPDKLIQEVYKIREPINNEIKNDYFVYRLLNSSLDKIVNHQSYLKFLSYCLERKEYDVLLSQLIIKTPKTNDPIFSDYIHEVINILSKEEDLLFKFTNRSAFLNSSWIFLEHILPYIKNNLYVESIFKTLFKTTAFSSTDNQKEILPLLLNTDINHKKLMPFFNKLHIENHMKSPISSIEKQQAIILKIPKNNLISVNLHNNLGSSILISAIVEHLNYIKINFQNLKISKIFTDYNKDTQDYNIYVFSSNEEIELNSYLLEQVIFLISKQDNIDNLKSLLKDYPMFIKEQVSQYMYLKLNKEISNKEFNKKESNKI